MLALLLEHRPAAISKAGIHERLWSGTFVSPGNVAVLITEIRDALDDSARQPAFIRTIQRFGYAFVAATADLDPPRPSTVLVAPCWLFWGTTRAPLRRGDNLIGRDPAADVHIDAIGISRRHAVIVVHDDAATLHDLASRNGTFTGDLRVTSPVTADGRSLAVEIEGPNHDFYVYDFERTVLTKMTTDGMSHDPV